MLFSDYNTLLNILIKGVCVYIFIILALKIFGKRSLAKLNAFDFIVTIALGSILASTLTNSKVTVSDGFVSILIVLFLQYLVSNFAVKIPFLNKFIKSEPALLYYEDKFLTKALEKERVQKEEIMQAVRESGEDDMSQIKQVILETNGSLSVIKK
ncbi:Protein of unknown function [Gracilibacillus ureilyticus]|uniref:DUF421 domain-containing protein n=1 Tax=Gracilibacillus ureilyticus TaxID=531814 RepID=A0A1H9U8M3_9BACI|nr:YetF domain-containing protein [Gracilibacillus ureilyticus]SES05494.1 Protein of unknown function [Gracilibacillus ureilyticus]